MFFQTLNIERKLINAKIVQLKCINCSIVLGFRVILDSSISGMSFFFSARQRESVMIKWVEYELGDY